MTARSPAGIPSHKICMLSLFLVAFAVSFAAALTPGPVIAVTLAKSYRSQWAGFHIALGNAVVEIPIILLIYFGLARFLQSEMIRIVMGICGGVMLVVLGILLFNRRKAAVNQGQDLPVSAFKLGIITSAINPGMVLWWVTVGALFVTDASAYGLVGLGAIALAIEAPNFIYYSAISFLYYRYHLIWSQRLQTGLIMLFSLVLIGFGIWYFGDTIKSITG